jgi:ankyrin repeat protein
MVPLQGWSPLHLAAYHGDVEQLRELLNTGIDPNTAPEIFKSQSSYPVRNRLFSKMREETFSSVTPLYAAAQEGNLECVKLLLERGADPFIKATSQMNQRGASALHIAGLGGHLRTYWKMKNFKPKSNVLLRV